MLTTSGLRRDEADSPSEGLAVVGDEFPELSHGATVCQLRQPCNCSHSLAERQWPQEGIGQCTEQERHQPIG